MSSRLISSNLHQELIKLSYGSYSVPNSAAGQSTSYEEPNATVSTAASSIPTDEMHNHQKPSIYQSKNLVTTMQPIQSGQPTQIREQRRPDKQTVFRHISSVEFLPNFRNEIPQLSEGTQTDENWLENLLRELECRNVEKSPLQKLAEVIDLVVDIRSPNPVLLSALPQIVGSFYGTLVDPEKDQNYRKTWRAIVTNHCSPEILIAPLPNGEEVLVKR